MADGDHDVVDCGPGRDTVYVEEDAPTRDTLRSCEIVVPVPAEPATDAPPPSNNIFGTVGNDMLFGTEGADSLFGNDGNDVLFGNGGDDYVDGENGDDELHGGPGNDALHGRGDNDVILGNEGDDPITGDRGNDTINGGPGNDNIFGNLDDDIIAGDEGDDRIQVVGGGFDRVSCGDGKDRCSRTRPTRSRPTARTCGARATLAPHDRRAQRPLRDAAVALGVGGGQREAERHPVVAAQQREQRVARPRRHAQPQRRRPVRLEVRRHAARLAAPSCSR